MNTEEIKARQREERERCTRAIVESTAKKKLIVAGAGTGKTFTFGRVIDHRKGGKHLAVTFIRKLVADMDVALKGNAEVKTFHAFCKKVLHQKHGALELVHFLPEIVQNDALLLGMGEIDFATKFRILEDDSLIKFYLERADYYGAVGFDDSVYRLLKEIQKAPEILPNFDQIVVDEFQDFNPLEVAFINELSKKGDILIVGDDDQAVYDDRSASPAHLRKLYSSPEFKRFELPFCGRCPQAVVDATNSLIDTAMREGHLRGRIAKRYECFLDDKEIDNGKYPKIVTANCTTAKNIPKYIHREIEGIDKDDIRESHLEGSEYPTVLIVGKGHYLREIEKQLRPLHKQITYTPSSSIACGICDAYSHVIPNDKSNVGWRILMELCLDESMRQSIIKASVGGKMLVDLLPRDFIERHLRLIELARAVSSKEVAFAEIEGEMSRSLGKEFTQQLSTFLEKGDVVVPGIDEKLPTISLTTFKGCKGLSAGHVFIVGVHNECMPKDNGHIDDVEISQFIVALTRTRKRCHILSNDWWAGPRKKKGWIPPFERSELINWIPKRLIEDRGKLRAADLK